MTFIQTQNGHLHYFKHQGGSKILLAFHGFGQDNKIFQDWIKDLKKEYTVYAFDLFYHGQSIRPYGKLTKDEWKTYVNAFLDQENIAKFSVVGFSLGGRFAITTSLEFPDKIDHLTLIAPDGIFLTAWFKLATHPSIRWLFKYFMLNPEKLDGLIAWNDKYKIVSPYLGDFVRKELGEAANRKRVYISWNHFKSLGYSRKQLFLLFSRHTFKRRIVLGSKDQIIKPSKILPLIHKMGNFEIDILPMKHHQLIKPEVAKLIVSKDSE